MGVARERRRDHGVEQEPRRVGDVLGAVGRVDEVVRRAHQPVVGELRATLPRVDAAAEPNDRDARPRLLGARRQLQQRGCPLGLTGLVGGGGGEDRQPRPLPDCGGQLGGALVGARRRREPAHQRGVAGDRRQLTGRLGIETGCRRREVPRLAHRIAIDGGGEGVGDRPVAAPLGRR